MQVTAVIPARYASTRFPGKPLFMLAGKPMVQRVYERAAAARRVGRVLVATDDERIFDTVRSFGGHAVMTSPEHATGTDRIAEAIRGTDADLILNVQGDEPLIPPAVIDRLVETFDNADVPMATVAVPFRLTAARPDDPNAVKVVLDNQGFALYFSRSLIPFCRAGGTAVEPLLHWGLYAYRRAFLEQFVGWPRGRLEQCEMLEQLRALENGARIRVIVADQPTQGVDTPADAARVESLIRQQES